MPKKIIKKNKTGLFDYQVLESYQAGIVLTGPEVKAIKTGHINLQGSYVSIDGRGEVWLVNAFIAPYKPAAGVQQNYQPDSRRKLLLNKKEIHSLVGKNKQKGLTIIPVSVYTINGLIKIEIALAKGKTQIDKRQSIKKREVQRTIKQALKKSQQNH